MRMSDETNEEISESRKGGWNWCWTRAREAVVREIIEFSSNYHSRPTDPNDEFERWVLDETLGGMDDFKAELDQLLYRWEKNA